MNKLESADLRLLRRLLMNPGMRQSDLARDLQVSRPMVNQTWQKLVRANGLRVKSSVDYGKAGMSLVFGWAEASETSDQLKAFCAWLESNAQVALLSRSMMSSGTNAAVYFEGVTHLSGNPPFPARFIDWSNDSKNGFGLRYDIATEVSNDLNMGLFDGKQWTLDEGFRFEASTGAIKDYADVLPAVNSLKLSEPSACTVEDMAVLSVLEDNYHASVRDVAEYMSRLGLYCAPERTLRRFVNSIRSKMTLPYVCLNDIGLIHRAVLCIDSSSRASPLSRMLHIQAGTLPKARVISGRSLSVMSIQLPSLRNWLALSSSLIQITKGSAKTLTFIAEESATKKTLEKALLRMTGKQIPTQTSPS